MKVAFLLFHFPNIPPEMENAQFPNEAFLHLHIFLFFKKIKLF